MTNEILDDWLSTDRFNDKFLEQIEQFARKRKNNFNAPNRKITRLN